MANYTSGSLTGANLQIGIALVLQDRFSNQAREASSSIRKLHNDAMMAVNANLSAAHSIADTVYSNSKQALGYVSEVVQTGAGFIDTMTTVKAISRATDSEMESLGDTAQSLGKKTMFSSQEIASGMQYLAMAGNSAKDIQEMIRGAAMVANATGMELGGKGGAADMITNIMKVFKMESASAATVVGDQLTAATLASNMSMDDLAETIKYASASMVNLKKGLPEVAAMAGTLGNAGIQASMAGTAMGNMARYLGRALTDASSEANRDLKALGISLSDVTDSNGDLLDFGVVLGKIKEATQDMGSMQYNDLMTRIFGVRGARAGTALMNDIEGYQRLLNEIINNSTGRAASVVEERMASLAGHIDAFRSTWENVKTTFTEAIAPILNPLLSMATYVMELLKNMLDMPILGNVMALQTVLVPLVGLVLGGAAKIRTSMLQMFGNSTVSAKNMFSVLMGGWKGSTIAASDYLRMESAILAQRQAGITGNTANAVMGGQYYYYDSKTKRYRDAVTGRMVSYKDTTNMTMVKPGTKIDKSAAGVAKWTMTGSMPRGAGAVRPGSRGVMGTIGRGLLATSKGIWSFLTGPGGLAITAGLTLIPALINVIRGNKEAEEENTAALEAQRLAAEAERSERQLTEEMRVLVRSLQYWATQSPNRQKVDLNIRVNKDGTLNVTSPDDNVTLDTGTK